MQCAKNVGSAAKLCAGVVDEDADSVGAAVLNTISAFLPEFKKLTRLGSMLVKLPAEGTALLAEAGWILLCLLD